MDNNSTIPQRIKDFRGFCASNRIRYKEVTEEAGLNYDSVIQNLRVGSVSADRMDRLEEAAIRLRDRKKKVTANLAEVS